MLRPWLVHVWDGRLATTRRPFRFQDLTTHVALPIAQISCALYFENMKPLLVLILDADSERRQELAALLEGAGHQVAFADGTAPPESSDLLRYDLLLLDPTRPQIDLAAFSLAAQSNVASDPDSLDQVERRHLEIMLQHTRGNKKKAAHLLGISRSTLLNKVRKYGLQV
jgi:DNA-binding NtrC family response regulator